MQVVIVIKFQVKIENFFPSCVSPSLQAKIMQLIAFKRTKHSLKIGGKDRPGCSNVFDVPGARAVTCFGIFRILKSNTFLTYDHLSQKFSLPD